MLILWPGWLCAVGQGERRDVPAEDTKEKPFLGLIVMQMSFASPAEPGAWCDLGMESSSAGTQPSSAALGAKSLVSVSFFFGGVVALCGYYECILQPRTNYSP